MSDLENFRVLGLSEQSLEALRKKGFEEPSPIQIKAIPLLITGEKDLIGQAQTGTGKTAAFGLPILEVIQTGNIQPQALILAPTRELCLQIAEELNSLKGDRKVSIIPLYGGQSIDIQLRALKRGVDIAVGTPGRIIDLMERGVLDLEQLDFAILDEADEMLNMGFVEDIEVILSKTPAEKRMLMFSATMPAPILKIAERFMRADYEIVRTETEHLAVDLTDQVYFEVRRDDKLEALSRVIDMYDDLYAMVFCRTKNDVDELTENLMYRGYPVEALHGDIAQTQRTKVINRFKAKKFNILIATDVAARGIDVNNLSHVINYSIPQSTEAYVHRIGRTGRAGKQGTAITFVTPAEFRLLSRIKKEANAEIRRVNIPKAEEIVEAKRQRVSLKIANKIAAGDHESYLSFAQELLTTTDHPAELVAALLKLKYNEELLASTYGDISSNSRKERKEKGQRQEVQDRTRLFLGIGRNDGYGPAEILQLIYEQSNVWKCNIGRIDIFDDFSYVNVNSDSAPRILEAFQNVEPKVELAQSSAENDDDRDNRSSSPRKRGRSKDFSRDSDRGERASRKKSFRDDSRRSRSSSGKYEDDDRQKSRISRNIYGDKKERFGKRENSRKSFAADHDSDRRKDSGKKSRSLRDHIRDVVFEGHDFDNSAARGKRKKNKGFDI